MKRKKAMAIVMVAAMTVTMLAGCGSSASDTAAAAGLLPKRYTTFAPTAAAERIRLKILHN